ncbi:MAG: GGDEF domain-containing protein [Anaerolineae bacterium]|nr:GGDEF domain-containing protein [Anaerolineae bacterium]
MKQLFRKLLTPPVFSESEKARQAGVLHYSSLMVAVFGLTLITVNLISGVESEIALNWALGLLVLFQIAVQLLTRLGKINQASLVLITICWFVTTVVSRSLGGVRDVSVVVYVLILLGSGFLIGWYFAVICMAFNIAAIWWLASLETNGVLVPVFGDPYRIAIDLTAIFILMLIIVYFFVRALTKALEKARMELVERTRIESDREKLIVQLSEEIKERQRAEDGLKQLARTDPLTGLFNRRHFFEIAGYEFAKAIRHQRPLSAIIFDVDLFKDINDTFGHVIGDQVLVHIGTLLSNNVRKTDIAARYGGEEFILLLPETDSTGAKNLAEQLRTLLECSPVQVRNERILFTVSIGVSGKDADQPMETFDQLILQADEALYSAKRSGRNQVVFYQPENGNSAS